MAPAQPWPVLLEQLLNGQSLSSAEATGLMQGWLAEQIDPVLTGALLAALRAKGASGEELSAPRANVGSIESRNGSESAMPAPRRK